MPAPVVVVTGPPGAGKSTVTELLVHRWSPSALVEGDRFFGFLREGSVAPWLPESHDQNEHVVEAAAAASGRLARGGIAVVYDGMIGPWFVDRFVAAAAAPLVHYAVLLPPADACRDRVLTRPDHGFRDLPATAQMYREFVAADPAERHVLRLTGDETPPAVADALADRVAAGTLLVGDGPDPPNS